MVATARYPVAGQVHRTSRPPVLTDALPYSAYAGWAFLERIKSVGRWARCRATTNDAWRLIAKDLPRGDPLLDRHELHAGDVQEVEHLG